MPMSHLPHNSSPTAASPEVSSLERTGPEYSGEERKLLLSLAHESISSALEGREITSDAPTQHLAEPRGVFTSLYKLGELRGCVGYVLPTASVYRAVIETARAAALDDNRFPPVTTEETPHLAVELSVLSPPQQIDPENIEVGRHGLLIQQHGRRGLLLPQVPTERSWDRTTFLEQTCRKAGLPGDAWMKGATILAFSAEVFGDVPD